MFGGNFSPEQFNPVQIISTLLCGNCSEIEALVCFNCARRSHLNVLPRWYRLLPFHLSPRCQFGSLPWCWWVSRLLPVHVILPSCRQGCLSFYCKPRLLCFLPSHRSGVETSCCCVCRLQRCTVCHTLDTNTDCLFNSHHTHLKRQKRRHLMFQWNLYSFKACRSRLLSAKCCISESHNLILDQKSTKHLLFYFFFKDPPGILF